MSRTAATLALAACLLSITAGILAGPAPSDPMRPDHVQGTHVRATDTPHWSLSSTLISAQRRLAVVNGVTVGVGDEVAGARVLAILPYAVKLKHDDRVLTVYLVTSDVKHRGNP